MLLRIIFHLHIHQLFPWHLLKFQTLDWFHLCAHKTLCDISASPETAAAEWTSRPDQLYFCMSAGRLRSRPAAVAGVKLPPNFFSEILSWIKIAASHLVLATAVINGVLLLSFPTSVCISPGKLTVRIASSALSLLNLAGKLVVRNPQGWYQHRGAQQGRASAGPGDIKWINGERETQRHRERERLLLATLLPDRWWWRNYYLPHWKNALIQAETPHWKCCLSKWKCNQENVPSNIKSEKTIL